MLNYNEIDKKYFEKFKEHISFPFDGFSSEEQKQKFYKIHLECIKENRKFNEGKDDSSKVFEVLPDDCVE